VCYCVSFLILHVQGGTAHAPNREATQVSTSGGVRHRCLGRSANGTPVYPSNLVNSQYSGLGLTFGNSWTAITHLNGVLVWAPVEVPFGSSSGNINYYTQWNGAYLNTLTNRANMTVSSLTVETIGNPGFFSLHVYGRTGPYVPLSITPVVQSIPGTTNEKLWKFTGPGIWSFSASVAPPPGFAEPLLVTNAPWGIAAVSFTPPAGQTPEPSSLVLAGLGALGLAARFGWRRSRGAIA
jgi:PEP-CTERM motif